MNKELNIISQQLLRYWLNNNIIKESSMFDLFIKIGKLSYMNYVKEEDLSSIISYIKALYSIPILSINVNAWLDENKHNRFIYNIYQKLLNLQEI